MNLKNYKNIQKKAQTVIVNARIPIELKAKFRKHNINTSKLIRDYLIKIAKDL